MIDEVSPTVPQDFGAMFGAPRWLRDLGRTCWLLVGVLLLLGGLIWLLGATFTIVGPLVAATIVAVVTQPIVDRLSGHMPRALAAALILVAIALLAVCVLLLVLAGIKDQTAAISEQLSHAVDRLQGWLKDAGVNNGTAASAGSTVKHDAPQTLSTLLHGIIEGIRSFASLAFGLSLAALSLFFLLKDGPRMRAAVNTHVGVPEPVARVVTGELGRSLRGYFRGVTLVGAFNGVVVTLGALALGVPLAGTIGIVSFITAYIPFIGAFVAGTFAVLIALGSQGTTTALIMLVIVILANGLLQNLVQPFAMGSALDLNPLVVLVVTIGSGCLFGTIGLILAAPIVAAAAHIPRQLRRISVSEPPDPAAPDP